MILSLIAAMDLNQGIGIDNQLPWHLPADLRWFKKVTMGHHLIVGRKTYQSIGKPLPGRVMIVLSRNPGFQVEGSLLGSSLSEALQIASEAGENEAFVIGGAEIYRQSLPLADHLYLSKIHASLPADAFFPEIAHEDWNPICEQHRPADEENEFDMTFLHLSRKKRIED
jgi:dihydrofolate reductase